MVAVAILAAGRGTRMKSNLPKVLHLLGGRSLIERVLRGCLSISPTRCLVIVGYQADQVKTTLKEADMESGLPNLEFVEQVEQLGTGHAIQQLLSPLEGFTGDLLVLNGDVPLLRPQTIKQLVQTHQQHQNSATVLTAHMPDPQGYGRVFCDGQNMIKQILEDRDCTAAQKQNRRINAGIYCFRWTDLARVLPHLQANNNQREYYLTETLSQMESAMAVDVDDYQEMLGINDQQQLATAYEILQRRIKSEWMAAGVKLIDPDSITIDDTVQLYPDVTVEPQTHLRGNTVIHSGSRVGPGSLIENSHLGQNVTVLYSVVTDCIVGAQTQIGPYAHLHGPVHVDADCEVGNFVELRA